MGIGRWSNPYWSSSQQCWTNGAEIYEWLGVNGRAGNAGKAWGRKSRSWQSRTFCSLQSVPIKKRFLRWFTGGSNWIANLSLRELFAELGKAMWIMAAGNRCHWPPCDPNIAARADGLKLNFSGIVQVIEFHLDQRLVEKTRGTFQIDRRLELTWCVITKVGMM